MRKSTLRSVVAVVVVIVEEEKDIFKEGLMVPQYSRNRLDSRKRQMQREQLFLNPYRSARKNSFRLRVRYRVHVGAS